VSNERDCPEAKMKMAEGLRQHLAGLGIADVADDEIVFDYDDETALRLRLLRRDLIAEFKKRQTTIREWLSLEAVADVLAKHNTNDSPDLALAKLMGHACVGAFDDDRPALLLLRDDVGVDLQWINPDRCALDGEGEAPPAAQMMGNEGEASLKRQREISGDAVLMAQVMRHCWVRREAVVSLLRRLGVTRAKMPPEWAPLPPRQARACVYFAERFGTGNVPGPRDLQRQVLLTDLLAWDKANGDALRGSFDDATLKLAVEAFNAGHRA
jgi:hypothetical protein